MPFSNAAVVICSRQTDTTCRTTLPLGLLILSVPVQRFRSLCTSSQNLNKAFGACAAVTRQQTLEYQGNLQNQCTGGNAKPRGKGWQGLHQEAASHMHGACGKRQ